MPGNHSSKQYDHELDAIRSKVLQMAELVENQFHDAVACFRSGDVALAERVMRDDAQVNRLEVTLDDACNHLILRRQPAANDLRLVMATVKVITDLERIGDEATKIGRSAKSLMERSMEMLNRVQTVAVLTERVANILHDALDSFARLDEPLAIRVIAQDQAVDQEFRTILRTLLTYMMEDPRSISAALDTLWAAKAMERIGDHAKNIAEYVIYVVQGKDIRHTRFIGSVEAATKP